MIRPREFSTREILPALPKEQRAQFLALDPAERRLLINGSDEEKEQYAWLPAGAAKKFAQRPQAERKEEAQEGRRARLLERAAPVTPAVAEAASPEVGAPAARVAESLRDIFELANEGVQRVQSIAANWLRAGRSEAEALDEVSLMLMDELPLPAGAPAPSRMQVMFGGGNMLRG